jgi:hypothetical protein
MDDLQQAESFGTTKYFVVEKVYVERWILE